MFVTPAAGALVGRWLRCCAMTSHDQVRRPPAPAGVVLLTLAVVVAVAAAVLNGPIGTGSSAPSSRAVHAAATPTGPQTRPARGPRVLAISIDGLNPTALELLGARRTPHLHRLLAEGAATLDARTQVEQTVTLPNHTSMITGRRIDPTRRGHGVTWNEDLAGTTIQTASGDDEISSVFEVVHEAGWSTALFATKSKFSLFERSWPAALDRSTIVADDAAAVTRVRRDLARHRRAFTFLHLGGADVVGHARGWMSKRYLREVRTIDTLIGEILTDIDADRSLRRLRIVLTADHGGIPGTHNHANAKALDDYRVPFVIWGKGVEAADLYALNPDTRQDPGDGRPRMRGTQPVRNGEIANVALDILGLSHVPGSRWDRFHDLAWTSVTDR